MSSPLPFSMPANACNAHLHIIDPSYPNDGKAAAQIGTVKTYQALAEQLGLPRAVFVQAKPFALDNTCLLDAIQTFGPERARGIAVIGPDVTDRTLEQLHAAGIRGLRFSVWNPENAVVSFEDCVPLSRRCGPLGWNIQLHMSSSQLADRFDIIRKLSCPVVIDHMGRLDPRLGLRDPAYPLLLKLIDQGNTWIKLSGPYLNTARGRPWHDASAVAAELARFAPERVLWGNDFPHVTERDKPSERELAELIPLWLPTRRAQELALSENPARLYGF